MVLKTQPLAPLETIYEESGSFIASNVDIPYEYQGQTINGLISARSIPSVDLQRQRANEHDKKPPIEVRFRDGSTRYIHPSTTTMMMINRRNLLDSSEENLSSNKNSNTMYRQIFHPKKVPVVLTIITAEDLNQAGITPTISSSPSESDRSTIIYSQTNSPMEKMKVIEDIQVPIGHNSTPYLPSQQQQQVVTNHHHHQNSIPSQSVFSPSHQSSITSLSSPKTYTSSLQITLTKEENQNYLPLNINLTNETVNQTVQPNPLKLGETGTRSAFRPVLKPIRFNQQPISIKPRIPSTINRRPINPPQRQEIVPYSQLHQQQYPPKSTSNITQVSYKPISTQTKVIVPKYTYNSLIPAQIEFNVATNPSLNSYSLIPTNSSNYHPKSQLTNHHYDNSVALPRVLNISTKPGQTLSFAVNPNMKWLNITSNSIYDIPRLSSKYSRIPLRITIPVVTPTHNQKLVIKHNTNLENRLLNAGLSPETVALYERILDIAENPQMNINQYRYQSLI